MQQFAFMDVIESLQGESNNNQRQQRQQQRLVESKIQRARTQVAPYQRNINDELPDHGFCHGRFLL
jgi:hypothetical protein